MSRITKMTISLVLCLVFISSFSLAGISISKATVTDAGNKYNNNSFNYPGYDNDNNWGGQNNRRVKNGLTGEYYNNLNFTGLKTTKIDKRINFDWEGKSPSSLSSDTFSIRWTGQVQPRYTETYTFSTIADDGARLWINNQLVINDWVDHGATETKGTISLEANKKYNIRLEYYENTGDACVMLLWSSNSQGKEIVPNDRLFSELGAIVTPTPPNPPVNPPIGNSQPINVNLSAYFNEDAFSYDSNRADGNFDGHLYTYSAELFGSNPSYDGTSYITGSFANGSYNSMRLAGQTIAVPQYGYGSIRLLGASTDGDISGTGRINYTDGTNTYFSLAMKDWCATDTRSEKVVKTMTHRHLNTGDDYRTNYVFAYYLSPDSSKTVASITMPNQTGMHVLAMTLLPLAQTSSGNGNGLYGEYFNNANLTSPVLNRLDAAVNFDWGQGTPAPGIDSDSFSVRWTGQVEPIYSGTYTFYTSSDDGVRLWVNNTLLINDWTDHSVTERSKAIMLQSGQKYDIRLEYYENCDNASVRLMWSGPYLNKQIIPQQRLYYSGTVQQPPVNPPAANTQPVNVDLSAYFNEDAFSYDSNPGNGNFDGGYQSYSANLITPNPVYDGTQYITGPLSDNSRNSLRLSGQTITVPQNSYASIRLLGASTNGDNSGIGRINYTDGTHSDFSLAMKDWCSGNVRGEKVVQTMAHRNTRNGSDNTPNYIFAYYVTPDISRTAASITMPNQTGMHMLAMTLLPTGQTSPGSTLGLNAEYFDNINFTGSKFARVDPVVDFDWGQGSPASGIAVDTFSARWTGQVQAKYTETYTFFTSSDDGVRLWVNNSLLIDDWTDHGVTERSNSITLQAGQKYNIKLEYYENADQASVKLLWSSPSQAKQVIPASQLYH